MVEVHEAGCDCPRCVRTRATERPWRVGSQVGRTIYVDPGDGRKDPRWLIGIMDVDWWAEYVVDLHNARLAAHADGDR